MKDVLLPIFKDSFEVVLTSVTVTVYWYLVMALIVNDFNFFGWHYLMRYFMVAVMLLSAASAMGNQTRNKSILR